MGSVMKMTKMAYQWRWQMVAEMHRGVLAGVNGAA